MVRRMWEQGDGIKIVSPSLANASDETRTQDQME